MAVEQVLLVVALRLLAAVTLAVLVLEALQINLTFSFVAALPIAAPAHSSRHDDSEPASSREHVGP